MSTTADPFQEIRNEMEGIVADPGMDPADKKTKLRFLQDRAKTVLSDIDRSLRDAAKLREAHASEADFRYAKARSNADIRGELEAGGAKPDDLTRLGYLSHEEIDDLQEQGMLDQRLAALRTPAEDQPPEEAPVEPTATAGEAGTAFAKVGSVSAEALTKYAEGASQVPTTASRYSLGTGVWDTSRKELHDQIIDSFMREQTYDAAAAGGQGGWRPDPEGAEIVAGDKLALFLGGAPGTGKATLLANLRATGEAPASHVMLTLDSILSQIPETQDAASDAVLVAYEEACALADAIQERASDEDLSLVYDCMNDGSAQSVIRRANALVNDGYEVTLMYVDVPTDVALDRLAKRAAQDGRMMEETVVRTAHRAVAATITALALEGQTQPLPFSIQVWNNDQPPDEQGLNSPPKLVWAVEDGVPVVIDGVAWNKIREKAHEPLESL